MVIFDWGLLREKNSSQKTHGKPERFSKAGIPSQMISSLNDHYWPLPGSIAMCAYAGMSVLDLSGYVAQAPSLMKYPQS